MPTALSFLNSLLKKIAQFFIRHKVVLAFIVSAELVLVAGYYGGLLIEKGGCTGHFFGFEEWYARWDGQWYNYITTKGYSYTQDHYTTRTFFPLYPLTGSLIHHLTGLSSPDSLMLLTWLCLIGFCFIWLRYATLRLQTKHYASYSLVIFLLWPVSYFVRINYSEAMFILLLAILLFGFTKLWKFWQLGFISGLLTAARPHGAVCAVVTTYHIWLRLEHLPLRKRVLTSLCYGIFSAWGLLLYMGYLWWEFGDPILFISGQKAFHYGKSPVASLDGILTLLSLKPIWGFLKEYSHHSVWARLGYILNNVIWFVTLLGIIIGAFKRWLSKEEVLLSLGILGLSYWANAITFHMHSVGRFSLTALPFFIVLTHVLLRHKILLALYLPAAAALLAIYTAMFVQMHCVF